MAIIVIGIIIAAYFIANRDVLSSGSSKTVTLVVDYDGTWTGKYSHSDVVVNVDGTGHAEVQKHLEPGVNIIRFTVEKGDNSSNELRISILNSDGKLLGSASTTDAMGVATIDIKVN